MPQMVFTVLLLHAEYSGVILGSKFGLRMQHHVCETLIMFLRYDS